MWSAEEGERDSNVINPNLQFMSRFIVVVDGIASEVVPSPHLPGALMKAAFAVCLLLAGCGDTPSQQAHSSIEERKTAVANEKPHWVHSPHYDSLHAKTSDVFVLQGEYLSVPEYHQSPSLVAICSNGKAEQLRLDTGVSLHVESYLHFPVEKRLDGQFTRSYWDVFDNTKDLDVRRRDFEQILYSQKTILGVSTIWGTQAVMQFEMADPTSVVTACGLARQK